MRALIVPASGRIELADIPEPVISPYQARVKIECCGICNSTDWKLIRGEMNWAPPAPLVLGHESVGRVVEVGAKVTRFKPGDRVTRVVYPGAPGLNAAMGGFAEFGVVTDAAALARDGDASQLSDYNALRQTVVPPGVGATEAALAISLAETASVLASLPSLHHKTVLIAGTGVAGLAFVRWARLAGARVVALGRRASRLDAARRCGADHVVDSRNPEWPAAVLAAAGGPVDGVIEAIGDVVFARQLLTVLKPDGFAAAYGAPAGGAAYPRRYDQPAVNEHLSYAWVADLLLRRWIDPADFLSHTWAFSDVVTAFEQVRAGDVTKGIVQL